MTEEAQTANALPALWISGDENRQNIGTTFDFLLRLQMAAGVVHVASAPTSSAVAVVANRINAERTHRRFACETLGEVIDALKVRETYNAHYRDFLLGNLTETELEEFASTVAYKPSRMDAGVLGQKMMVLLTYTTAEFTSSDVAELFRTSDECVRAAAGQLSLPLEHRLQSEASPE